ncbi:nucleoside triphosphate pyrophosphohydrolase [Eggerthella sinensis]|uniref:Nucleoside triphosphate pyrophosphohydrolase n=1 Tax=Eggerthella sinensis TaxID=242230 RepID=A0A3N0IVN8_9ACTN|nr:nucleoside triphosphate pyrophosphohydrolase [Eggerthella sinensis]RDB68287.1 nucleoside triphosphate pyrophosphohydrolase [Eggerthella sinensis]RNM41059.1 nucleoside triphosphate pyrophosphohydrolase [Eggerthella sinensis]
MTASPAPEPASEPAQHPSFDQFVDTIAALRAPDGCPWDRVQTHESIAHNMIEEAYEAVDAIEAGDAAHLREELGDVLLQVVLQSQIAADDGAFTIDDVCADVNAKMVRRHPHVFGEVQAANASEVLDLWDQVKLAEKGSADEAASADDAGAQPEGLLDGVPTSFPALMQAQKISRKAAAVGFEWETLDDVWAKVREEVDELREAYAAAPKAANGKVDAEAAPVPAASDPAAASAAAAAVAAVEEEFGDVLFSLVNVGRRMGVDAEGALRTTCRKFRDRWAFMEQAAHRQNRRIEDLDLDALEALWTEAKHR